jgi:hypothetical protein
MTPHGELLVSSSSCDVQEAALPILSCLRGDAGNRDDTGSGLDEVPRVDGRLNECVNWVKNWLLASTMGSGDCAVIARRPPPLPARLSCAAAGRVVGYRAGKRGMPMGVCVSGGYKTEGVVMSPRLGGVGSNGGRRCGAGRRRGWGWVGGGVLQ